MSIFTKIIAGEISCEKIAEDDKFFCFMDIRPVGPGHVLVVPKEEIDYFFDMEDDFTAEMMVFAKKIAAALKKVVPCKKVGLLVVGIEVPHVHVHLIPINSVADTNFEKAKEADPAELKALGEKIRNAL